MQSRNSLPPMWSVSLTTAESLSRLCAHTERPQTCTRIAAHHRAHAQQAVNLASAHSVMYCALKLRPRHKNKKKTTKKKTKLLE